MPSLKESLIIRVLLIIPLGLLACVAAVAIIRALHLTTGTALVLGLSLGLVVNALVALLAAVIEERRSR